jgi:hypothetical protein
MIFVPFTPGRKSSVRAILFVMLLAVPRSALAQADANDHAAHHPAAGVPSASSPAVPGSAPSGGMGPVMNDMMGMSPSAPADAGMPGGTERVNDNETAGLLV